MHYLHEQKAAKVTTWLHHRDTSCKICVVISGIVTGFSPSTSVFPHLYHSTNAPYPFIHLPPTLYNVSLPVLQFSPVTTIPPMLHTAFIFILLLSEGQTGKAWEPLNKAVVFLILGSTAQNTLPKQKHIQETLPCLNMFCTFKNSLFSNIL